MAILIRTQTVAAGIIGCAIAAAACGQSQGITNPGGSSSLKITSISPTSGSTFGSARVQITGDGFQEGMTVTVGAAATAITVTSRNSLSATVPVHDAGTVDVVVTNGAGESSRLAAGFRYVEPPALTIIGISPNRGSTEGGTSLKITGTGFNPGAEVTLDGITRTNYVQNGTTIYLTAPEHPQSEVDVVVKNPDGLTVALSRAYTFAHPGAFDFNGEWEGGAELGPLHGNEAHVRFTIRDNALRSITCEGVEPLQLTPPVPVRDGRFLFAIPDGATMSGRLLADAQAVGEIKMAPCGPTWYAFKRQ